MLNRILRYCCGYIRFEAVNGFPERLINLCAANNISLTKIKKTEEGFQATTLVYCYKKIKQFAEKVNVETRLLEQKGFPFWLKRYHKRWGFLIGILVCILFIFISQQFVWDIEVEGNQKVSTQLILSELEEQGIRRFSYIPHVNFTDKKQTLMLRLPQLSWMSVNINGCKLKVSVSERYTPPQIKETVPCDIVASKTGQIRYMEVYNGVKKVEQNYTVKQGDVIVSGSYVTDVGENVQVHADAKVIAEVQFEKTLQLDINQLSKEYTGETKSRYYIDFFSAKLPLFIATKMKGNYDIIQEEKPLVLFSKEIPIGITKKKYRFYDKKNETLTQQEAIKVLRDSFRQYEAIELKKCAILQKEEHIKINKGILCITRHYIAEEDIALKKEIVF